MRVRVGVRRAMLCHELEDAILTMAILTMAILTTAILTMAHHDFEDAQHAEGAHGRQLARGPDP